MAPGGADANQVEFAKVILVLMEGQEIAESKKLRDPWGNMVIKEMDKDFGKCLKAAFIVGLVWRGKTTGL
jgi:hypothetical protein